MLGYLLEHVINLAIWQFGKKNSSKYGEIGPFFSCKILCLGQNKKIQVKKRLKGLPKKIIGLICCKNWFYFSLQFCDVTSHHSHSHLFSTRRFSQIWLYMRCESKTIEASFCIVGCLLEPIIEIRLFIKKNIGMLSISC
jgi:hypothetical protein